MCTATLTSKLEREYVVLPSRAFTYVVRVDGGLTLFLRTMRASLGGSLLTAVRLSMTTARRRVLSLAMLSLPAETMSIHGDDVISASLDT